LRTASAISGQQLVKAKIPKYTTDDGQPLVAAATSLIGNKTAERPMPFFLSAWGRLKVGSFRILCSMIEF
jgi:hypothetical protein